MADVNVFPLSFEVFASQEQVEDFQLILNLADEQE